MLTPLGWIFFVCCHSKKKKEKKNTARQNTDGGEVKPWKNTVLAIIKSPQLSVRGCHCLNRTVNIWAKCAFSPVCLCFALLRGTWSSKRFLPAQCNVRLRYRPAKSRSAGLPNEQNPFHAVCKTNTLSQSVHCATTFLHARAPRISHVSAALFRPCSDNKTLKCNSTVHAWHILHAFWTWKQKGMWLPLPSCIVSEDLCCVCTATLQSWLTCVTHSGILRTQKELTLGFELCWEQTSRIRSACWWYVTTAHLNGT